MHPDLKPLHKAVKALVAAELADAWSGAGDPADVPIFRAELKEARRDYKRALDDLNKKIEAYASIREE